MTNSVVFSNSMERKFLSLAMNEGAVVPTTLQEPLKASLGSIEVDRESVSQIHANLFLNPTIHIQVIYEVQFESRIDGLEVEVQTSYEDRENILDPYLLCALARARDQSLTPEKIHSLLSEAASIEQKVIESFGAIPTKQADGALITFQQAIEASVSRSKPTIASSEQKALYELYETHKYATATITEAWSELNNVLTRYQSGDSLVIDPRLQNNFTDYLDEEFVRKDSVDRVDLFYLHVKELKTLPVGRTLAETIALAKSSEGTSLRKRIEELHFAYLEGELEGVGKLVKRIREDVEEYKRLTSRLITPNSLSDTTDLTLSSTSLIPMIGTYAGAVGLAKTAKNIVDKRSIYKELQENRWVEFKGATF